MRDAALLGARLLPGGYLAVAAAHNREGGLMAARGGVELPVAYATRALALAAAGPGKYKLGPALPGRLAAIGALAGGAAAGALIATMISSQPAPAEPAAPPPVA